MASLRLTPSPPPGEEPESAPKPAFIKKRSKPRAAARSSLGGSSIRAREAGNDGQGDVSMDPEPSAAASSSNSASHTPQPSDKVRVAEVAAGNDDDEDEAPTIVVRTKGLGSRKAGPSRPASSKPRRSNLSFAGDDADEGDDASVPPGSSGAGEASLLKKASILRAEAYRPPENLDQATLAGPSVAGASSSSSYSPAALAALKASTPTLSRVRSSGQDQQGEALTTLDDPMSGGGGSEESLTRLKFGADFAHDGIPSEAMIKAIKEKRRRAAAAAATGSSEDFISLGGSGSKEGSSALERYGYGAASSAPRSRTQGTQPREEDELGDGEEVEAAFTEAMDRIPIGKAAVERERQRAREERRELVERDGDGPGVGGAEGSDDSEDEWERAQLARTADVGEIKRRREREKSPYRPAPIPLTAPLPTTRSTSARLQLKLKTFKDEASNHSRVADDAGRALEQLRNEEKENRKDVESTADKEAWFREMETFVKRVGAFLEEKYPTLEAIEKDGMHLLWERTRLIQRTRARDMEDELSLFFGVPELSLLPPVKPPFSSSRSEDEEASAPAQDEPSPVSEGNYHSPIRIDRRSTLESRGISQGKGEYDLSPADALAFVQALTSLRRRKDNLLDDVKAPEFREPDAKIEARSSTEATNAANGKRRSSKPHPASLVSRFSAWRARYPEEYAGAWGGLLLSKAWHFWARKEMSDWLVPFVPANLAYPLPGSRGGEGGGGGEAQAEAPEAVEKRRSLEDFQWYKGLTSFVESGAKRPGAAEGSGMDVDDDGSPKEAIGGDDEALRQLISDLVVSRLLTLFASSTLDPFSPVSVRQSLHLIEEVSFVLEPHELRFQSLAKVTLDPFLDVVRRLKLVLSSTPIVPAPPIHPEALPARISFLTKLQTLLSNLVKSARALGLTGGGGGAEGGNGGEAKRLVLEAVDALMGDVMWGLLREAKEVGGREMASEILKLVPAHLTQADVRSRYEAFASSA